MQPNRRPQQQAQQQASSQYSSISNECYDPQLGPRRVPLQQNFFQYRTCQTPYDNQQQKPQESQVNELFETNLQNYIDQILKEQREDFVELHQKHLLNWKKSFLTLNSELKCAISKEYVEIPVQLTKCVKQGKHFDTFFDLSKLLLHFKCDKGKYICPHCDLVTEEKFNRAFIVNKFFINLLIYVPKVFDYKFDINRVVIQYTGKYKEDYIKFQRKIFDLFEKPSVNEVQFDYLARPNKNQFLYYAICLHSQSKINIPVKSTRCRHFDCFDALALIKYFQKKRDNQEQPSMECPAQKCNQIVTENNMEIDFVLYDAISKSFASTFTFIYNPFSQELLPELTFSKQIDAGDVQISSYRLLEDEEQNKAYQRKIQIDAELIYSSDKNAENSHKFYREKSVAQLRKSVLNFHCELTGSQIQIPCRCIRCPQIQVCDLKYMCCILDQFKDQNYNQGLVSKKFINCPLCNSPFTKAGGKPPVTPLREQVYVDTQIMHFIQQSTDLNKVNQETYILFLAIQNSKIEIKELEIIPRTCAIFKINWRCKITGRQIKDPVRGVDCKHKEVFDLSSLVDIWENQKNQIPMRCPVPECNQPLRVLMQDRFAKNLFMQYFQKNGDKIQEESIALYPAKLLVIK